MILHFSASMLTLFLLFNFVFVCTHLYVLNLSMFIQRGQKGKREKKKSVLRNDILDRPLDSVVFLKLMRVNYNFFHVFLGIDVVLLPSLISNITEFVVSLTSLDPPQAWGWQLLISTLPPSEKHLVNMG